MRLADIHVAVDLLMKQSVAWSTIKMCLSRDCSGPDAAFERASRGRYRLAAGIG
jgi:hypothetical protein